MINLFDHNKKERKSIKELIDETFTVDGEKPFGSNHDNLKKQPDPEELIKLIRDPKKI